MALVCWIVGFVIVTIMVKGSRLSPFWVDEGSSIASESHGPHLINCALIN